MNYTCKVCRWTGDLPDDVEGRTEKACPSCRVCPVEAKVQALLDVGPPKPVDRLPTKRELWAKRREEVIEAQEGKCAACKQPFDRLDVIGDKDHGELRAYCRRDRVILQSSTRMWETMGRQKEVPGTRRRKSAPIRPAERNWSRGFVAGLAAMHRSGRNASEVRIALTSNGLTMLGLIRLADRRDVEELLRALVGNSPEASAARGATLRHLKRLAAKL